MKTLVALLLLVSPSLFAQSVTVTWTNTHQTMDGWGGEDWKGNPPSGFSFTSGQADMFFSRFSGIGLEYIRTANYMCPVTGSCTVSTSLVPDLTSLQEAVARGAKVEIHIQPPANLQYSGNFTSGAPDPATGNCIDSSNWAKFANFTVRWIQMLNSNSAPVSVLAVGNEPDLKQTDTLGACVWTASGLDQYIANYLGPTLDSAGVLSSVKVALPDASDWFSTDLASTCLNDSSCSQYISIVEGHDYGLGSVDGTNNGYCCHTATAAPSGASGKHIWMDEVNGGLTYQATYRLWTFDTSMTDALVWAHNIHDFLTIANVSGWVYWELADECAGTTTGGCAGAPYNDGLTDGNFNASKRYYVVGNWSRYVRSGWVRIDATPSPATGTFITAFKEASSGEFAIIAVNGNPSSVKVAFLLAGFPSVASLTPTLTSASADLLDQPTVDTSGGAFSYLLPPSSVVTFHGTVSSSAAQPPSPATDPAASVR
jgi:glucuronoarabinoxylan endo-1,4-beta-xylanase